MSCNYPERRGLKYGDIVRPTDEYRKKVKDEYFEAKVVMFPFYDKESRDIVELLLLKGREGKLRHFHMTTYWLQKVEEAK